MFCCCLRWSHKDVLLSSHMATIEFTMIALLLHASSKTGRCSPGKLSVIISCTVATSTLVAARACTSKQSLQHKGRASLPLVTEWTVLSPQFCTR